MIFAIILLPLRFQIVNGSTPIQAGYRLLALTIVSSLGGFIAGILTQRLKLPHLWILLGSAPLQIIGLALLGTLNSKPSIQPSTYAYEVILALGFGGSLGSALMMVPLVVKKQDMAVGMSSIGQFRSLGGAISIAITTTVLNNHITTSLSPVLSASQLVALRRSVSVIKTFPLPLQEATRSVYAEGYNLQMNIMTAFAAGAFLASLLVWERVPRRMA